jgi:hypothetical protein
LTNEIAISSIVLNRIGQLKARADGEYREIEFDLKVYENEIREKTRASLAKRSIDEGSFTAKQIFDRDLANDVGLKLKTKKVIRLKADVASIEQLYWAIKSKDDKLQHISKSVVFSDFERELSQQSLDKIFSRFNYK